MKYIIVIAGNITQFRDFVRDAIERNTYSGNHGAVFSSIIVVEGITFKFVNDSYQLKGYDLGDNAKLVKVGSWYKLPKAVVEDIEVQFGLRAT